MGEEGLPVSSVVPTSRARSIARAVLWDAVERWPVHAEELRYLN